MSDGNTTVQVSPVTTEEDMEAIRKLFQRATDAIVGASHLASEVANLRSQVEAMTNDLAYLRRVNQEQDNLLSDIRQARNHAQAEAKRLADELVVEREARQYAEERVKEFESTVNHLAERVNDLTKQRDDAQFNALQLSDDLKAAKERLADIRDFAKRMFTQQEAVVHIEPTLDTAEETKPWWEKEAAQG